VVEVTVTEPVNEPPAVEATADVSSGPAPLRVRLRSAGNDPDGSAGALTYEWDFGDGGQAFGRNAVHTYADPGTYTATVTVSDPGGASGSAEVEVVVAEPEGNRAPTVRAAADPASGTAPQHVRFSAAGSDPDGDALAYVWDFGDGVRAGGRNATHTYRQAGLHPATVTVTDRYGATGSATVQVTVGAAQALGGAGAPFSSLAAPPAPAGEPEPAAAEHASGDARVVVARHQAVRRIARRGLRHRVGCETACRAASVLRIRARTARRLGLPPAASGPVELGDSRVLRVAAGTSRTLVVRLDRRLSRSLLRTGARRVRATLATTIRGAGVSRRLSRAVVLVAPAVRPEPPSRRG